MVIDRLRSLAALASAAVLVVAVAPCPADEIWVAPAAAPAEEEVGNWAATEGGETRFSFAVPEDLSSFAGAKIVVISTEDVRVRYDLSLSLSQDGYPQDVYTVRRTGLGPESVPRNQLREIDVSAIFPDLAPGTDYVTLRFRARERAHWRRQGHGDAGRAREEVHVVGLRFQYGADVFVDETTGNVGIGTATPRSALEVNGTVAAHAFASTSPLVLEAPAGSERLRIDDVTGNVGIGTTVPVARLDVNGNVAIAGVPVIDSSGRWVGDPTGLQGPPGADGAPGTPGPPGPPGAALAYAHVRADGNVDQDSGNIAVTKVGPGAYCVGVTGGTVHVAVASLDAHPNVGGSVQAGVFHASDCTASGNNDVLVITRPHAQDGGLPGADRAFYIIVN